MKFTSRSGIGFAKGDMTPMIDMTFQLIAFFMVLVNFSEADTHEKVHLPASELAKPPDAPMDHPITIQLTDEGDIIFFGQAVSVSNLAQLLVIEREAIQRHPNRSMEKATVVIRADAGTPQGRVLEVIEACQNAGFIKFALRARQGKSEI
jgi:biopolymer transport protein ExbD